MLSTSQFDGDLNNDTPFDSFIHNLYASASDSEPEILEVNENEEDFMIEEDENLEDEEELNLKESTYVPASYSWCQFLDEFQSKKRYEDRVKDFYCFSEMKKSLSLSSRFFDAHDQYKHHRLKFLW